MSVTCKLRLTESEGPESLLLVKELKQFREGLHGVGYQLLRLIVIIPWRLIIYARVGGKLLITLSNSSKKSLLDLLFLMNWLAWLNAKAFLCTPDVRYIQVTTHNIEQHTKRVIIVKLWLINDPKQAPPAWCPCTSRHLLTDHKSLCRDFRFELELEQVRPIHQRSNCMWLWDNIRD